GSKAIRFEENEFTWAPIQEVGALFVAIFLTMVPALQVLRAAAPNLPLNEITLFVLTGAPSSVRDNAPTYVTFLERATQLPGAPPSSTSRRCCWPWCCCSSPTRGGRRPPARSPSP